MKKNLASTKRGPRKWVLPIRGWKWKRFWKKWKLLQLITAFVLRFHRAPTHSYISTWTDYELDTRKTMRDSVLYRRFWPKVEALWRPELMEGPTPEACPPGGGQRQRFWSENTITWLSIPTKRLYNRLNPFPNFCSWGPMGVCLMHTVIISEL